MPSKALPVNPRLLVPVGGLALLVCAAVLLALAPQVDQ